MIPVALSIAGSDPSGGAGLQADLKTFHQHGVYGMSVVTLLTAQNTLSVSAIQTIDCDFISAQLDAVLCDIPPSAAKAGALGSAAIIDLIARRAKSFDFPLVVDPVMVSKHGNSLIDDDAVDALVGELLPHAFLVTPNAAEAARLSGLVITNVAAMETAAEAIASRGVPNVLIKGGQIGGDCVDVLWTNGRSHRLSSPWINTPHTHGTGCVFSAAITARLASGEDLFDAVLRAKRFVTSAIRTHPGLGSGVGPINLFSEVDPRAESVDGDVRVQLAP